MVKSFFPWLKHGFPIPNSHFFSIVLHFSPFFSIFLHFFTFSPGLSPGLSRGPQVGRHVCAVDFLRASGFLEVDDAEAEAEERNGSAGGGWGPRI